MNPDGYSHTTLLGHSPSRGNTNGVDLNRAFPTWEELGETRDQLMEGREKEVGPPSFSLHCLSSRWRR
jgi:murein tripeptide amidase MpaA